MPTSLRAVVMLSLVLASAAGANVASAFLGSEALAKETRRTDWFMATIGDAVAISQDSSDAVRALAAITKARAVMQQVAAVEVPLPVRVFAVKGEASLRELVPQYWERRGVRPSGASYAGPHAGFIAMRIDIPASLQFPLLMHEYVHLLTKAHVPDAPAWLDEGLSEFWGALALDEERIVIGRPPANLLKVLRTGTWLTPDKMQQHQRGKLDAGQASAAMFYAQSWAMVHYLLLGGDQAAPLPFAPPDQQWTPQLDAALRAYVSKGQFREVSTKSNVVSAFRRTETQPISESRALAERANMLVFGERPDAALPLARKALALNAKEPLALEVIGTHYFLSNQPDQARTWLSQSLEADPGSYTAALYLSLLSTSSADRERYLQAAVKAKPDLAIAWQRLWTLYREDGRADQARRWCSRYAARLQPWLWLDQPFRCEGLGR